MAARGGWGLYRGQGAAQDPKWLLGGGVGVSTGDKELHKTPNGSWGGRWGLHRGQGAAQDPKWALRGGVGVSTGDQELHKTPTGP